MAIPIIPDGPVDLARSDLRRVYAKLNALEATIRGIIRTLADNSDQPPEAIELMRAAAMEEGDTMARNRFAADPEFDNEGMLETLAFISQTFARVKGVSG